MADEINNTILRIYDGIVDADNGGVRIGFNRNGNTNSGYVTLYDSSSLNVFGANDHLLVGLGGKNGTLDIRSGSGVIVKPGAGNAYFGHDSGSVGKLFADGNGSLMRSFQDLTVGNQGIGVASIRNGGKADITGDVFLARANSSSSDSSITVTGTNSALVCNGLYIGGDTVGDDGGDAYVKVSSGGRVSTSSDAYVGVRGPGSGRLEVDSNGDVDVGDSLYIGHYSSADGSVHVTGGAVDVMSDIWFGQGGAELLVEGGIVTICNDVGNAQGLANGEITLDGGSLVIGGTLDLDPFEGGISSLTFRSGELRAGSVLGDLTIGDGSGFGDAIHTPGQSPGIDTIFGDYTLLSDAALNIELGGTDPGTGEGFHDQVEVSGDVFLDGTLMVSEFGGFEVQPGRFFEIIDVAGTLGGTFSGLPESALVGNFSGTDLFITYHGGDGNDVGLYSIPEPSTLIIWSLLGVLGITVGWRRRRKR